MGSLIHSQHPLWSHSRDSDTCQSSSGGTGAFWGQIWHGLYSPSLLSFLKCQTTHGHTTHHSLIKQLYIQPFPRKGLCLCCYHSWMIIISNEEEYDTRMLVDHLKITGWSSLIFHCCSLVSPWFTPWTNQGDHSAIMGFWKATQPFLLVDLTHGRSPSINLKRKLPSNHSHWQWLWRRKNGEGDGWKGS